MFSGFLLSGRNHAALHDVQRVAVALSCSSAAVLLDRSICKLQTHEAKPELKLGCSRGPLALGFQTLKQTVVASMMYGICLAFTSCV